MDMSKAKMENRALPKRFYREAAVQQNGAAWHITLDGRVLKTPAKQPLLLRSKILAEAIAAEWDAQVECIQSEAMPLMRLASITIDRVPQDRAALIDEIVRYAGTDLLCYPAPTSEELGKRQRAAYEPVLAWARQTLGMDFVSTESIMPVAQPEETLQRMRALVSQASDAQLAALAMIRVDVEQALVTARIDENYHAEQWGADEEAAAAWAAKEKDIRATAFFLTCNPLD
ncbi:MAG: ATPase [Azospirillum brasilense]|nr:MAG: ATPase [Azospirillum brasilense]